MQLVSLNCTQGFYHLSSGLLGSYGSHLSECKHCDPLMAASFSGLKVKVK